MTLSAAANAGDTFDYIIIGAGAAGAVLANRLSADPSVRVCLLEAGGGDLSWKLRLPAGFLSAIGDPQVTWQYASEPTAYTKGRRIGLPQGRALGGTTAINGMIYNRGQAEDFDDWAQLGNRGWSYAEILPYFRRSERLVGGDDSGYHGTEGPLTVTRGAWRHPLCEAFIAAADASGIPRNDDYNGASQAGVGYFQRSIGTRWRVSSARAFLDPVKRRANLSVRTRAQVARIATSGRRATGVVLCRPDGRTERLQARREVLLCAGALNTPKLLELSGIGQAERLMALGISPVHDLPGVGENLSDHFSVRVVARARNTATINEMTRGPRLAREIARWVLGRPSLLAVSPSILHWFAHSRPGLSRPDLQGVFTPASYREGAIGRLDGFPGMTAGVWGHRPQSRGGCHAASADLRAAPHIRINYLEAPEDRQVLIAGIRKARALLAAPALAPYFDAETMPGPGVTHDDEILDFAGRFGMSAQHLSGTARMGPASDATAVVGPDLKVHGLDGLRVVDASVMPRPISANTMPATFMIAEKAADMILGKPAAQAAPHD